MVIERSHVAGLLVPVTVVIVGHHVDVVEVLVEDGHVVTFVDDLLARRNGRTQEEASGLEGRAQFFDQG